jgi:hypothetical protein
MAYRPTPKSAEDVNREIDRLLRGRNPVELQPVHRNHYENLKHRLNELTAERPATTGAR